MKSSRSSGVALLFSSRLFQVKRDSVFNGGGEGNVLIELLPDKGVCFWPPWRCLCLKPFSSSNFASRFFFSCRCFKSSADVSENEGVENGGEHENLSTILVSLTLTACFSTVSRIHITSRCTKCAEVTATRASTFMENEVWALFSMFLLNTSSNDYKVD